MINTKVETEANRVITADDIITKTVVDKTNEILKAVATGGSGAPANVDMSGVVNAVTTVMDSVNNLNTLAKGI